MPKQFEYKDKFTKKAQFEGFRARSVYKLQELDQRLQLFKEGQKVLDVGAAPGSWLQYISQKIGDSGLAVGVDIQSIRPIASNVILLQMDINQTEELTQQFKNLAIEQFDIVVSDIAPSTTGIPGVDQAKSVELSQMVVDTADRFLKPRGTLIMKVFQGEDFKDFYHNLQGKYGYVTTIKVKASRDRSAEIYVVCQRKR
jgi:23S rRNA (uridine2552-2'-O)-methyltransferase